MIFDQNINYPKITIVTPSFNQGAFLEETILSIINQNYPNLEYIIIDGGSNDNSIEIIKKHQNNINYWVSEKDFGQSHAINKGFAKATGEILNWINSDDILQPNSLFQIANSYLGRVSDNVVLVGHGYEIDENSNFICERKVFISNKNESEISLNLNGNPIQQSIFFSKKLFSESGGINPLMKFTMDIDLHYKFGFLKPEILIIDYFLASFRKHTNSKTIFQEHKMLLEKLNYIEFIKPYGKNRSHYENQISFNSVGFSTKNINFKEKLKIVKIFIKNTPICKRNLYKYRIIFVKLFQIS